MTATPDAPLLTVQDLHVHFHTPLGRLQAVAGVNLTLQAGETLGLVGESGCGKTVTALSVLRLLPPHTTEIEGEVHFAGENLLDLSPEDMRRLRGNRIGMVFQEPMTSLNPVFTVGDQVAEVLRLHRGLSHREARVAAIEALTRVGLPDAARRFDQYPHELSGGLRQRVLIAMALACGPELLIADEPTTALDVTIQAQILALLTRLRETLGLAVLFITHNLGVVAHTADRVAVMYAGLVVEEAPTTEIFQEPCHPYTWGLLASVPKLDFRQPLGQMLPAIPGQVPGALEIPAGCLFRDRCLKAHDRCEVPPPWLTVGPGHHVRCWLYENRS
uniref:ABC transporter ATP-binding protein n=1 Tax=Desulfobacca acetoxidans TaxID=60893 RepID=A0A7C3ZA39_9BACT